MTKQQHLTSCSFAFPLGGFGTAFLLARNSFYILMKIITLFLASGMPRVWRKEY